MTLQIAKLLQRNSSATNLAFLKYFPTIDDKKQIDFYCPLASQNLHFLQFLGLFKRSIDFVHICTTQASSGNALSSLRECCRRRVTGSFHKQRSDLRAFCDELPNGDDRRVCDSDSFEVRDRPNMSKNFPF